MSKHRERRTTIHPKLRHWRWAFRMPSPTSREQCGSLELVAPSGHVAASVVRLLRAIRALPGRHPDYVFTHARRDGGKDGDLAGVPWATRAIAHKFADWRDEFAAAGLAIQTDGPHALTLYQLRRDVGADVLRMTGSHAESAEVLGHSPEVNARHYASFEANRAADLAERMERRRAESGVTPTPPASGRTSPPRSGVDRAGRTEPEPD